MEIVEQLTTQSPKVILALVLCVIGWRLKKSPCPNWIIPFVLMIAGGTAYPFIARAHDVDYTSALVLTNVLIGLLIGGASVGLHQTVKQVMPFLFANGDTDIEKPK